MKIGSTWINKKTGDTWKLTDIYISVTGYHTYLYQLEKYQAGRNSPAYVTAKRLKDKWYDSKNRTANNSAIEDSSAQTIA